MRAAPPVRKTEIDKFQIMWRARSVFSYHRIAFILNDRNQQKKNAAAAANVILLLCLSHA